MLITGRRIRTLARHLAVADGTNIIIGKDLAGVAGQTLRAIGFAAPPQMNSAVVPAITFGPTSRFNALGKEVPNRALAMEDAYRTVFRRWEDWHGNEHSGYVTVTYRRYPRIVVPPPGVEFRIAATTDAEEVISTETIAYTAANSPAIVHRINLFLEIFGECEVFTDNLQRIIQAPVVRLNWDFLPRGQNPWPEVQAQLEPIIHQAREVEQPIIENRLETLNAHDPAFVAIGRAGFSGYVVFGFPALNLFLMESIRFGNATYGFGQNWEVISQLSKAEVLNNNLHTHRIIHRDGWHAEIEALFV